MPFRTPTPSLSRVRHWDTAHLTDAADRWITTAGVWDSTFNDVATHISSPGGAAWQGVAAEGARQRADADRIVVSTLAERLNNAADIARRGADHIGDAKAKVLEAVDAAEVWIYCERGFFSRQPRNR